MATLVIRIPIGGCTTIYSAMTNDVWQWCTPCDAQITRINGYQPNDLRTLTLIWKPLGKPECLHICRHRPHMMWYGVHFYLCRPPSCSIDRERKHPRTRFDGTVVFQNQCRQINLLLSPWARCPTPGTAWPTPERLPHQKMECCVKLCETGARYK